MHPVCTIMLLILLLLSLICRQICIIIHHRKVEQSYGNQKKVGVLINHCFYNVINSLLIAPSLLNEIDLLHA